MAAKKLAARINEYLTSCGWPGPLEAESGNGIHLLYRIDLPNDATSTRLVKSVLIHLDSQFSTPEVKVDRGLFNAGRVIKLYGTVANKGNHTVETPHRLSRLVKVPESVGTVTALQMQSILGEHLAEVPGIKPERSEGNIIAWLGTSTFNVTSFLEKLAIPYEVEVKDDGSTWYHLHHCPFNKEHGYKKSAVSQRADGTLGFHCFHNSCCDNDWHALRRLVEGHQSQPAAVSSTPDETPSAFKPPQKLPPELRPVEPLNPAHLPERMRDGLVDIAERLGCPLDFVAIPSLIAAGAVIGNRVGILPKQFDESWVVHPGLWGGVIAPPGSMKSPALNLAIKPLTHLEKEAAGAYGADMQRYKAAKAAFEKAVADFRKGQTSTYPTEPVEPVKKRYVVNDVTYQALGAILVENPQGVLAIGDELSGLLQSLDAPGQEAARGFFLSGW